ncbi:MAG: GTPase HflX [Omnitrophica WOR_2 bacterium RIFCSPHIGHO2_02_FULL_68_15]|nr:MAG: GTPase HflX [Omnitrophica WOR_2 bacterium RIFCSPHIGHO2_02_FULL_68_15]
MLSVDLRARERAVLVALAFRRVSHQDAWPVEEIAAELKELVRSSGVDVLAEMVVIREAPTPGLLMGRGKAESLRALVQEQRADVVIVSHDLSPAQQRNLEALIEVKVIDRTQLILDIFAQRAHSQEGKVQVALAQHEYLLPRLTGKGIALSRLGGGIGTRGPGEQKLELDRRRIRAQIGRLQRDLVQIRRRRAQVRRERQTRQIPMLTLVGYTNAGKTTLFNALTKTQAVVADQLFTTLDPTARRILLPTRQPVVISDTVGFLHHLPHHLIEAFQATLEEVLESHLLVHVVDAAHPQRERLTASVEEVLRQLAAEEKPQLLVFNKCDRLDEGARRRLSREAPNAVQISALTGEGVSSLRDRIASQMTAQRVPVTLVIPQQAQQWVHRIYEEGTVTARRDAGGAVHLDAVVPLSLKAQLLKSGFLA